MEHPYLFLPQIFGLFGAGHFAQTYPHVVYSWLVLLLLIVLAYFGTRRVSLVPGKAQNFFEVLISGMEEFMVDITGEEGRWFFPIAGTLFLYIATCNLIGLIPGFFPPTASINTTLSCALVSFTFTHFLGDQISRWQVHQTFPGTYLVDDPDYFSNRSSSVIWRASCRSPSVSSAT